MADNRAVRGDGLSKQTFYIFLDEGGDLNFSDSGSRFFSLSCVSTRRPFILHTVLDTLKYDLIQLGLDTQFFHCSQDNRHVRHEVFSILEKNLHRLRIDSLLVEKCKTTPAMRKPQEFYPRMLGYLLRNVFQSYEPNKIAEVVVITDNIPLNKKRKSIEKAVKVTLVEMLPEDIPLRALHHASKAHYGLQIADYCNWAIFRKWEQGDDRLYRIIQPAMKSEYSISQNDVREYFGCGH